MPSRRFFHIKIDEFSIYLSRDFFCSRSEACSLVEEGDGIFWLRVWPLILDEAAQERFSVCIPFEQSSDCLFGFYLCRIPATAQFVHERSEVSVLDVLVYFTTFLRLVVSHTDFLIPFPAAKMAQEHENVLAFCSQSFGQFAASDFHSTNHLFVRDVEAFEGLDEDVAEIVVESLFYAQDFLLAFLWKGAAEVVPDEFPPVPNQVVDNGIGDIAEQIQDAERQSCKEPHQVVSFLCPVLVHRCNTLRELSFYDAKLRKKGDDCKEKVVFFDFILFVRVHQKAVVSKRG